MSQRKERRLLVVCVMVLLMIAGVGLMKESQCSAKTSTCKDGDHDYRVELVKHATQEKNGQRKYTCNICGHSYKETIPHMGHHWGEWKTTKAATKNADGIKTKTCPDCGESKVAIIPRAKKIEQVTRPNIITNNGEIETGGGNAGTSENPGIDTENQNGENNTSVDRDNTGEEENSSNNTSGTTGNGGNGSGDGWNSGNTGSNERVPFGAADAAIVGANGVAMIFWAIVLLPLLQVLWWIAKKKRERDKEEVA